MPSCVMRVTVEPAYSSPSWWGQQAREAAVPLLALICDDAGDRAVTLLIESVCTGR